MSQRMASNDPECVRWSVLALRAGGILALPTETVYGLVCSAGDTQAILRLASLKSRPVNKPFALFTPSWQRLEKEAMHLTPHARKLAARYWPGPLTLVLPAEEDCPGYFRGSVGVRCPNHSLVQEILREYGNLLINTSLNRSGESPVHDLEGMKSFLEEVDLTIDGGKIPLSLPSTVVDCRGETPVILREGALSRREIEETLFVRRG